MASSTAFRAILLMPVRASFRLFLCHAEPLKIRRQRPHHTVAERSLWLPGGPDLLTNPALGKSLAHGD